MWHEKKRTWSSFDGDSVQKCNGLVAYFFWLVSWYHHFSRMEWEKDENGLSEAISLFILNYVYVLSQPFFDDSRRDGRVKNSV